MMMIINMMLEKCKICNLHSIAVQNVRKSQEITGISEIKIKDKPVMITDSSILWSVLNGYHTVSKIKEALDNAYFKTRRDRKLIFGGRTEGNLRARLKVLDQLGLIVTIYSCNKRVPEYEITNLGIAVQNVFMSGLDLFTFACSDCITERMQSMIKGVVK